MFTIILTGVQTSSPSSNKIKMRNKNKIRTGLKWYQRYAGVMRIYRNEFKKKTSYGMNRQKVLTLSKRKFGTLKLSMLLVTSSTRVKVF